MKNYRSSFIYIGIALGLFSYIWLYERHKKPTDQLKEEQMRVFDFSEKEVASIGFFASDKKVLLWKNKKDQWKIKEPVVCDANELAIKEVLEQAQFARVRRKIDDSEMRQGSLKEWGIAPPLNEIEFQLHEGEAHRLKIGRKTLVSDTYWAQEEGKRGKPLILINSATHDAFTKKIEDLRSRTVFNFQWDSLQKISLRITKDILQEKALLFELIKKKPQEWRLHSPIAARVNSNKMRRWIATLIDLQVQNFVSDNDVDVSQYGLLSPRFQITLEFQGGKPITLLVGSSHPDRPQEVYAKYFKSPSIFTVLEASLKKIIQSLQEVQEMKVVEVEPSKVTSLKIKKGKKTLLEIYKKKTGEWFVKEKNKKEPADEEMIASYLNQISMLEAKQIVQNSGQESLQKKNKIASIKIEIGEFQKKKKSIIIIKKKNKKEFYVKNGSEPFLYLVEASFLESIPKHAWQWVDHNLFSIKSEEIKSLSMRLSSQEKKTMLRNKKGEYTLEDGRIISWQEKAKSFTSVLPVLRVARWIQPTEKERNSDILFYVDCLMQSGKHWEIKVRNQKVDQEGFIASITDGDQERWFIMREDDFKFFQEDFFRDFPSKVNLDSQPPLENSVK